MWFITETGGWAVAQNSISQSWAIAMRWYRNGAYMARLAWMVSSWDGGEGERVKGRRWEVRYGSWTDYCHHLDTLHFESIPNHLQQTYSSISERDNLQKPIPYMLILRSMYGMEKIHVYMVSLVILACRCRLTWTWTTISINLAKWRTAAVTYRPELYGPPAAGIGRIAGLLKAVHYSFHSFLSCLVSCLLRWDRERAFLDILTFQSMLWIEGF